MRITLAAVGRLKKGPDQDLFNRYWTRFENLGRGLGLSPTSVVEIPESRAAASDARSADEAGRLIKGLPTGCFRIVLDETGTSLSSAGFARIVQTQRDGGTKDLCLLLGGPDGHGDAIRRADGLVLALGPMTWPHGLARVMLAEQLYRTATILAGHPYHRA